jgi:hypothetical protein
MGCTCSIQGRNKLVQHFVTNFAMLGIILVLFVMDVLGLHFGYLEHFSSGVKRPKLEYCYSPPSNAEVKNTWKYTFISLYIFMECCLIKHRDKFTILTKDIKNLKVCVSDQHFLVNAWGLKCKMSWKELTSTSSA